MYICLRICLNMCVHGHMLCMRVCLYTRVHSHICKHIYIPRCIHTVNVVTHAHTHTRRHTYAHAHVIMHSYTDTCTHAYSTSTLTCKSYTWTCTFMRTDSSTHTLTRLFRIVMLKQHGLEHMCVCMHVCVEITVMPPDHKHHLIPSPYPY